jgi:peptidoglycan/LPS O-acetylase OafA/YrhL
MKVLGSNLPRLLEYILGTVGLVIPITVAIWYTQAGPTMSLAIIWSTVVSGGLATLLAYWVDDWADKRARAFEAEAREKSKDKTIDEMVERLR